MAGIIKRNKKKEGFTQISNETLRTDNLSWKAKGLLCYLLSHDDDFEIRKSNIHKHATDGYDSTNSAFKELQTKGYIKETGSGRDEKGNFVGFDYEFDEKPIYLANKECFSKKNSHEDAFNPFRVSRNGLSDTGYPLRETPNKEEQVSIPINSNTKEEQNKEDLKSEHCSVDLGNSKTEMTDSQKAEYYVKKINETILVDGKKRKFKSSAQIVNSLKKILKQGYSLGDILKAVKAAMKTEYHWKTKYQHLTPNFFLRQDKLEKYLNMEIEEQELKEDVQKRFSNPLDMFAAQN